MGNRPGSRALVLVGFGGNTQSEDLLDVSQDTLDPLPATQTLVLSVDAPPKYAQGAQQRILDISRALREGTRRILLIVGPNLQKGFDSELGQWLQRRFSFTFSPGGPHQLRSLIPQLSSYFHEEFAFATLGPEEIPNGQVLAEAVTPEGSTIGPAALRIRDGKSDLFVFPTKHSSTRARESAIRILTLLPPSQEYPDYLDEIDLGGEADYRQRIKAARKTIEESNAFLERRHRAKQILFFTEGELEHEVVRFLNEELGLEARWSGGSDEDFWLIEEGEAWCIGEVKGFETSSIPRQAIGKLDDHRKEASKPDDFPALLVGNTFHRLRKLEARDQPIASNVVRRAADDHILLVRTLDLVRLLALAGKPEARSDFLAAIKESGGWFEVTSNLEWLLHKE